MKLISKFKWMLLLAIGAFAVSCTSPKEILYFQDIDQTQMSKIEEQYEPVIMKDDKLQILISGPDKSIISPYNFTLSDNTSSGYTTSQSVVPYLVDSDGCIDMPGLGRMKVEGMRRVDLVKKITDMYDRSSRCSLLRQFVGRRIQRLAPADNQRTQNTHP